MVGADPKSTTHNRAAMPFGMSPRWRVLALLAVLVPLSSLLVQCGKAPPAETLAANAHATRSDTFEDRFPAPQFRDRFPSEGESLKWPSHEAPRQRTVRTEKITPPAAPIAMIDSRSRVRRAGKTLTRIRVTAVPTTAGSRSSGATTIKA